MAHACGKVILLGEHAVVYGVPALAVGIERGVEAVAHVATPAAIQIGDRTALAGDGSDLGAAYLALLTALDASGVAVDVILELPPGAGLGASAAIAVAAARAVLDLTQGQAEANDTRRKELVLSAAAAWEGVYHGNPSGIDAAAAAQGGCIWFTKEAGVEPVVLARDLPLAVAIAGPPASTKDMVESVARLRERRPEVVNRALDGISSLVRNARLCIEAGDLSGLGKLMDFNQMLLAGLFLSTEGIEHACTVARAAGALGAKLTGAGGGGSVVALVEENPDAVLQAWRDAGLECFAARARVQESA
jgi:mevalonate kinase